MSADLTALFPLYGTIDMTSRELWTSDEIMHVLDLLQHRGLLAATQPFIPSLPARFWAVAIGGCLVGWGVQSGIVTSAIALLGRAPSPSAAQTAAAEINAWCERQQ